MSNSSESDFTDIEVEDKSDKPYQKLANRSVRLRYYEAEKGYKCPFCPNKKRRYYSFRVLLGHAHGIANGSVKRRGKVKANHRALERYLKNNEVTLNH